MLAKSAYRSDIDGLRGIAVLVVVLFHVTKTHLRGGFVGVDVFFVISGYLITGIILREIETSTFSIAQFYERRIRRIFPALFATLALTLFCGYFLLMPGEFKSLGESAAAVTVFVSNILFWQQSGYFDAPAEHKVLLHTWSLAVEEQFYIFFPLLLVAIRRFGRSRYAFWLSVVGVASFGACVYMTGNSPEAAFYLAPPRAWELMLGAIIACGVLPDSLRSGARNTLGAAGLGLIAASVFLFNSSTPFPGLAALLPTVGAALIIYSGSCGTTWIGRLLSVRPLVFVGMISYSLYLLHWPLIVFLKQFTPMTRDLRVGLVMISFVLSVLSWRFIERPFRSKKHGVSRRRLFEYAGAIMAASLAIGVLIHWSNGLPQRLNASVLASDPTFDKEWDALEKCNTLSEGRITCTIGRQGVGPSFLLWGDSHAGAWARGVSLVADQQAVAGHAAWLPICPPLLDVESTVLRAHRCATFNAGVLRELERRPELQTVILGARWAVYANGNYFKEEGAVRLADSRQPGGSAGKNPELLRLGLSRLVQRLRELHRHVVLLGEVPEVGYQVPSAFMAAFLTGQDVNAMIGPLRSEYDERNGFVMKVLNELDQIDGVDVRDVAHLLCDQRSCRVADAEGALYRDDDHLSSHGSRYVVSHFGDLFGHQPAGHIQAISAISDCDCDTLLKRATVRFVID